MVRVAKINGCGGSYIGHYWRAALDLVNGCSKKKKIIKLSFRDPLTGIECITEKDNGRVLVDHLTKLLNAIPAVKQEALDSVRQRAMRHALDALPSSWLIKKALRRQNSGKATGDSKIPAEYFQACLDSEILFEFFQEIIIKMWNQEVVPDEWVGGRIKMLPKDGDLLDPGRWRSITLLDAAAKIMSTILTFRLNTVLEDLGIEMQNGFTPKRGTTDGSFCVRTVLKRRHEHGQETYCYFLDLVKAFDTVPRAALLEVLAKFGIPPRMVKVIENMYSNCTVTVDVGQEEFVIPATAGVKQGDNLAPVLFLIYIQAVLETLDQKYPERKKLPFKTKFDHILHGHLNSTRDVTSFEIGESLYADDAFFGFATRAELEKWAPIIDQHFTDFGLQVHKGKVLQNGKLKKSKTECMFFPRQGGTYEDGNVSNVEVDGGFYTFTKQFKYLGSIISWDLKADSDIEVRLKSARGAFATLRTVLKDRSIQIKHRSAIYAAIVLSILLYGGEYWAMREDLLRKLEVFHNQCVRVMCHVNKFQQWTKRIKTKTLLIQTGLCSIREMIASRQLRWFGHVVRMKNTRAPKMLLTCWVDAKRPVGRPEQHYGHSVEKCLKLRTQFNSEDLERKFIWEVAGVKKTLDAQQLAEALMKTTGAAKQGELTCTALAEDRHLWRQIVNNRYGVQRNNQRGKGRKRKRRNIYALQEQQEREIEARIAARTGGTGEDGTRTRRADGDANYDRIHLNLPRPQRQECNMIYAVYGHNTTTNRMMVCPHLCRSWTEAVNCSTIIKEKLNTTNTTIKKGKNATFGGDRERLMELLYRMSTKAEELDQQHESKESKNETNETKE